MHLHCLPQAIDSNSIVIMLASFISVPSLVSLTEKFTNSQDLMYKKLSPLSHVRVVSLSAGDGKGLNGGWRSDGRASSRPQWESARQV